MADVRVLRLSMRQNIFIHPRPRPAAPPPGRLAVVEMNIKQLGSFRGQARCLLPEESVLMYKIGDIVRVLPDSYRALIKRELRDPSAWQRADPINNKEVMLGGRYAVRRVYETRVGTFYGLIEYDCNHADRIRENFVVAEKDVSDCPYKVGDKVLFRPK